MIYNDECVGLQLPMTVELKVVECDPGVRGNSATSRTKPAKLETGLIVQVPEYLVPGRDGQGRHPHRHLFVPRVESRGVVTFSSSAPPS